MLDTGSQEGWQEWDSPAVLLAVDLRLAQGLTERCCGIGHLVHGLASHALPASYVCSSRLAAPLGRNRPASDLSCYKELRTLSNVLYVHISALILCYFIHDVDFRGVWGSVSARGRMSLVHKRFSFGPLIPKRASFGPVFQNGKLSEPPRFGPRTSQLWILIIKQCIKIN